MKTTRLIPLLLALTLSAHALTLPVSEDTSTTTSTKVARTAGRAGTLPVSATRSALVRFEVSAFAGTLSAGDVTGARLTLYIGKAKVPGDLTLHAVTSQWSEVFASPVVVPTIDGTTLATIPTASVVAKQFVVVNVTAQVKAWLTTPASDFGFAIMAADRTNVLLSAKEGSGSGYPAVLEIDTAAGAGTSFDGGLLVDGSVTSVKLAAGAVGSAQLGTNLTLGGTTNGTFSGDGSGLTNVSTTIPNGSITAAKLASNAAVLSLTGGGDITVSAATGTVTLGSTATSTNTASAIVRRDSSGYFAVNGIDLPATTSSSVGVIRQGNLRLLHTFGMGNFFAGRNAGNLTMTGSFNTASGDAALSSNTTGNANTASGSTALNSNTTGYSNTASGYQALNNNTTGYDNTASGSSALTLNTIGYSNTANGKQALFKNTTGSKNVAVGSSALETQSFNNGGAVWDSHNVAVGWEALYSNEPTSSAIGVLYGGVEIGNGSANTALGSEALRTNTTGYSNTASGAFSLYSNSTGFLNTASGAGALDSNTAGDSNTASGAGALHSNTTGSSNTASGAGALYSSTGNRNIAVGAFAGFFLGTGDDNICIGNDGSGGGSGIIRIGTNGTHTKTFLAGNVGIGTSAAAAYPLEVVGSVARVDTYTYFGLNNSTLVFQSSGSTANTSIKASNEILASHFSAYSDERIKDIVGRSDRAADLGTLLQIEITDYLYKDKIDKGSRAQKKVIAQQVEKVFPQAVSRTTGVVPDIFREAPIKDGWVSLATDLKPGERVRLITEQGHRAVHEVLEVGKDRFRTDFTEDAGRVFVYGREVDDFRSVDYEAISMLNVSATQELAHKMEAKNAEIAGLKQQLAERDARDRERDSRLERLERLLSDEPNARATTAAFTK